MKRQVAIIFIGLAGLGGPFSSHAQTRLDLRSQAKSVDFSAAGSTIPFKSGAAVPSSCQTGQVFFKTGESAGNNIYFCNSTDKWMQLVASVSNTSAPSDGCSPGSLFMLNDSVNGIHQLYVCSTSGIWSISSILSGTAGTRPVNCAAGQLFFSTDSDAAGWSYCQTPGSPGIWSPTITGPAGLPGEPGPEGAAGVQGPPGPVCGSAGQVLTNKDGACAGVTQIPVTVLPTPFNGWTPFALVAGAGSGTAPTVTSVQVDTSNNISTPGSLTTGVGGNAAGSIVAMRGIGTAKLGLQGATAGEWDITPPANFTSWTFTPPASPCGPHQWWTTDTDGNGRCSQPALSDLSATSNLSFVDTNQSISGDRIYTGRQDGSTATHTLPARTGAAAGKPATCTMGEMYFATDATPGQNWYYCTAANTWTQQLNSGAGMTDWSDPSNLFILEPFIDGSNSNLFVGTLGWSAYGTGATFSGSAGIAGHVGGYNLNTGISINSTAALDLGGASAVRPFPPLNQETNWTIYWKLTTPASLAQVSIFAGLQVTTGAQAYDSGAWIRYSNADSCTGSFLGSAGAASVDSGWTGETRTSGASSVAPLGPIVASTSYWLRMRSVTAGTILFSTKADGGSWSGEASLSTNITSSASVPMIKVTTCNGTAKTLTAREFRLLRTGLN
jgi:hypothetical protein